MMAGRMVNGTSPLSGPSNGSNMHSTAQALLSDVQGTLSRVSVGMKKRSLFAQEVDPNEIDRSFEEVSAPPSNERRSLDLNESMSKLKGKRGVPLVETMTPQEQENHYSQCIEMCNKNKVNSKNAFKLQLIDYMNLIVAKRNEKADNLSLMSCTLDASAKIYSFRVEKVYSDMMKIIASKDGRGKLDDDDDEDENDGKKMKGDAESSMILENLRTNMDSSDEDLSDSKVDKNEMKFISSPQSFHRGGLKKAYYGTYMPRGQELFAQSRIGREGRFHLDCPLFEPPETIPRYSTTDVMGSKLSTSAVLGLGNLHSAIKGYGDLAKKFHIVDSENLIEPDDLNSTFAYDPSAEVEVQKTNTGVNGLVQGSTETSAGHDEGDYQPTDYDDFQGDQEEEEFIDCERVDVETESQTKSISSPSTVLRKGPRSFTVAEMCRLISEGNAGDYSYFDQSKFDHWNPPKHWKIKEKRARSEKDIGTSRKRKKGEVYIAFMDYSMIQSLEERYQGVVSHSLLRSTIASWKSEKTIQRREMEGLAAAGYQLFSLDLPLCSSFNDFETRSLYDSLDGGDDVSFAELMDDQLGGQPTSPGIIINETVDEPPLEDPALEEVQMNVTISETELPDENDGLVPKPKLTNFQHIELQKAPKRIDIKLVKDNIWSFIQRNCKEVITETVMMKEMYKDTLQKLPQDMELTPAMAFLSLLYVANEKNLRISKSDQGGDLNISVDTSVGE